MSNETFKIYYICRMIVKDFLVLMCYVVVLQFVVEPKHNLVQIVEFLRKSQKAKSFNYFSTTLNNYICERYHVNQP